MTTSAFGPPAPLQKRLTAPAAETATVALLARVCPVPNQLMLDVPGQLVPAGYRLRNPLFSVLTTVMLTSAAAAPAGSCGVSPRVLVCPAWNLPVSGPG